MRRIKVERGVNMRVPHAVEMRGPSSTKDQTLESGAAPCQFENEKIFP
jgi:hypothetical protein